MARPTNPDGVDRRTASVEDWARQYILSDDLQFKLNPGPVPEHWLNQSVEVPEAPGRPPELHSGRRGRGKSTCLQHPAAQAKLLHSFFHHELQAAELMCWAALRFWDSEPSFRQGLIGIALDEVRHANGYRVEIERLGFTLGDFAVRDWFWSRVPTCRTKIQFVALMGMGLEAANLEHAPHFEAELRRVGADSAAALQAVIAEEEQSHVSFAAHWFSRWTGGICFEEWKQALPPPLSPLLMRGKQFDREARLASGLPRAFIDALERWTP